MVVQAPHPSAQIFFSFVAMARLPPFEPFLKKQQKTATSYRKVNQLRPFFEIIANFLRIQAEQAEIPSIMPLSDVQSPRGAERHHREKLVQYLRSHPNIRFRTTWRICDEASGWKAPI